ncbi:sensor histidine kinase [Chloroflexota bacterium]
MSLVRQLWTGIKRQPMIIDGAIAFFLSALALVLLWYYWEFSQPVHPALAIVLTLAVILPLTLRRRFPLFVLLVINAFLILYRLLDIPEGTATAYALLLALFSVGAYGSRRWRTWARGISVGSVAVLLTYLLFFRVTTDTSLFSYEENEVLGRIANILLNLILFGGAWWVGDIFRTSREREEENARQAVINERVRIAREIHDVVAHHVSVMGIQAGGARRVLPQQPEKAKEALSLIESSSRQAVSELHRLLGFLRQGQKTDELSPQPSLRQLRALVNDMQEAGLPVEVKVEGTERPLPPGIDLSAYRIIQEALTNTLKHAGATKATVTVSYANGVVELEIVDNGKGLTQAGGQEFRGKGIMGMRERVNLHGGRFETGNIPEGGFSVRVTLPVNGEMP